MTKFLLTLVALAFATIAFEAFFNAQFLMGTISSAITGAAGFGVYHTHSRNSFNHKV